MVYVMKNDSKRLIHFGDKKMKDFTQHHDKNRKKNYLTRSAGIKDGVEKNGKTKKEMYVAVVKTKV